MLCPPLTCLGWSLRSLAPRRAGRRPSRRRSQTPSLREIVSADSMQVYQGLPILTNQPDRPTALVGIWPLDHEGSVAEYQRLAHEAVDGALSQGRTPIVVGGTGLYLRAALADLELPPAPPSGARERWERLYDRLGPEHGARRSRRARSAGGASRSPERPTARRPRPGAARGGRIARTPARPALERGDPPPDADLRPRRPEGRPRGAHPRAHGGDVRKRGGRGGRTRSPGAGLADREPDHRPARDRRAPTRRGGCRDCAPHAPICGLPAEVDAPDSQRSSGFGRPPGRWRSQPRSSRGRTEA